MSLTDFIQQVIENTDMEALAAQSGAVRKSGHGLEMLCPFHSEHSPSMKLWPETATWHCFGACAEGGDVIDWVMKRDNLDFMGALKLLADGAGLQLPKREDQTPAQIEHEKKVQTAQELLQMAAGFYHQALRGDGGTAHREYLIGRGFSDEKIWDRWMVGAAGSGNGLLAYFKSQGVDIDLAVAVGLISRDEDTGRLYDFFRNRVILPFLDGKTVTFFTGRHIADGEPKYLHLKNTEYAKKTPYNWRNSGKGVVIVEGPLDVWAVAKLAPKGIVPVALMGLGSGDPMLAKAVKRADRVYVALDSDKAGQEQVDKVARAIGAEKSYVITWPEGKDAAGWFQTSTSTNVAFGLMLESACPWLDTVVMGIEASAVADKAAQVEQAVQIAATISPAAADVFLSNVKKSVKKYIKAKTIDEMVKNARAAVDESGSSAPDDRPYFYIRDGELWRGYEEHAVRILANGYAHYVEMVRVDAGDDETKLEMTLEVCLRDGRKYQARVGGGDSADTGKVLAVIKSVAGALIILNSRERTGMAEAIEKISKEMLEKVEVTHTGWACIGDELVYLTPGGIVGTLPEGYTVKLRGKMNLYAVADGPDELFLRGLDGLINGFLNAFDKTITYPALAFALLPPMARWLGKHKFALHLSGETGALKSETAKYLSSLYGAGFIGQADALFNWKSTINAIEEGGYALPDVLALVDDYKPSVVNVRDVTALIQRYAEGNARQRLDRNAQLRADHPFRGWMISTGEDVPQSEASVLARMVTLRFPRRPIGTAYNANLAKAQRMADGLPVVMARWVAWLRSKAADRGFLAKITLFHQQFAAAVQEAQPGVPNVNRIAMNVATLAVVWEAFIDFLVDCEASGLEIPGYPDGFGGVGKNLAVSMARYVVEEKPIKVFINALQDGVDNGRFSLVSRKTDARPQNLVGYYDDGGVYVLAGAFHDVLAWMRQSGQEVSFTKGELYRLLTEEGLLAATGDSTTVVISVGDVAVNSTRRVLHFRPDVISAPKGG